MKKSIMACFLGAVLSVNAFAFEIVQTKSSFKTDAVKLKMHTPTSNPYTAYAKGNTDNINLLSKYGNTDVDYATDRISLTKIGEDPLQCVAFLKAVTNARETASWRKGDSISPLSNLPQFTPVAVFNSNGTYSGNYAKHAALLMKVEPTGIYLLDQNHKDASYGLNPIGHISYHFVPFDNSKSGTSNAYNYSVITQ